MYSKHARKTENYCFLPFFLFYFLFFFSLGISYKCIHFLFLCEFYWSIFYFGWVTCEDIPMSLPKEWAGSPSQTNAPLMDLLLCAYVPVHAYLPIICGAPPGLLHLHNKNICHQHLSANIRVRCQVSLILGETAAGRAEDLTHEVNEWLVWC